jgi:hypothetical protein
MKRGCPAPIGFGHFEVPARAVGHIHTGPLIHTLTVLKKSNRFGKKGGAENNF